MDHMFIHTRHMCVHLISKLGCDRSWTLPAAHKTSLAVDPYEWTVCLFLYEFVWMAGWHD